MAKNEQGNELERILVTGSSRGIGRAIALFLGQRSATEVVVHCVNKVAEAEACCEEIRNSGGQASCLQFDVSNREQAAEVLTADIASNGAYYGVVLNAGITDDAIFPAMSGVAWDKVIATNLGGFYNVLSPLIMPMIRRRKPGRIVTISSASGEMGNPGQANYSAAKAGIIGASKALALELASRKITVNCVTPGFIETEMTADLPMEQLLQGVPLGRAGSAEEVASLVNYLMSADSAYITRQVIAVNGGLY